MLGFTDDPLMFAIVLILLILVVGMIMDAGGQHHRRRTGSDPGGRSSWVPRGSGSARDRRRVLIGTVTPPIGVAYFTGSSIARAKLEVVAVEMVPYLLAEFGVLFLMMIISPITMWLPKVFGFVE